MTTTIVDKGEKLQKTCTIECMSKIGVINQSKKSF